MFSCMRVSISGDRNFALRGFGVAIASLLANGFKHKYLAICLGVPLEVKLHIVDALV